MAQQREVIAICELGLVEAQSIAKANGKDGRAERVLHRLADVEINGQWKGPEDLHQAHAVFRVLLHRFGFRHQISRRTWRFYVGADTSAVDPRPIGGPHG